MLTNKDKQYLIESVLQSLEEGGAEISQRPSLASQISNLAHNTDPSFKVSKKEFKNLLKYATNQFPDTRSGRISAKEIYDETPIDYLANRPEFLPLNIAASGGNISKSLYSYLMNALRGLQKHYEIQGSSFNALDKRNRKIPWYKKFNDRAIDKLL